MEECCVPLEEDILQSVDLLRALIYYMFGSFWFIIVHFLSISWEQWHLRVVVNNTPRPLSDDCAAMIERQRIQVRTKVEYHLGNTHHPCMFVGMLCRHYVDINYNDNNSFLWWNQYHHLRLSILGYGRRNVAISADEGLRNSWCIYRACPPSYVRVRNKLFEES